ncbi:molecular chaperone HtpG [Helicobacter enhydrae]|uniref:Chaperone protein HtpG n=1 Tax=Helicobacter enhydrae TaxID=222136 RepID=A0A1B1U530_9HELI|nr:molecular chaperone HtpG [Helicobacter enhydrae]ANV97904.1 molecular chaperone HtpG [Helicobacter enhydrae]
MAKHTFQTEISQLLDLMIHSLYSNKEIFLRELVSNASDALDKLNYLTLTDEKYKSLEFSPKISITFEEDKSITITDNGIGMNEEDLKNHLGTIAKSGTKSFLQSLSGDKQKDSALIGQFGVGFYAAFMVADKIVVQTKKAGEDQAYAWVSDGKGEFEITQCIKADYGTQITLYLKEGEKHFASRWELKSIIDKYSDHIAFPIFLEYTEKKTEEKDGKKEEIIEEKNEQVNSAKALWKVAKSELKDEDYKEFYKSLSYDQAEPLAWIHTKVEGNLEYTTLFYIPSKAPFDLYRVDYKSGVKLYVKRVFITDDDKELLPSYLRFVKGIVDTEDLPLNVSREIIQQNKILSTIKSASTKKILAEIEKISKEEEKYQEFYAQFGNVLKEGLYGDFENKEKILSLLRFYSHTQGKLISLKDYKNAMKEGQKSIYYLMGENLEVLKNSPTLEKYTQKGFDVLLFADEIDGFVMPNAGEFDSVSLKDITSKEALEELGEEIGEEEKKEFEALIATFKECITDSLSEVRLTHNLTSPLCVLSTANNPMMANLMAQMGQKVPQDKVLEINTQHPIIQKLKALNDLQKKKDMIALLYGNAKLLESGALGEAKEFCSKLNALIEQSL